MYLCERTHHPKMTETATERWLRRLSKSFYNYHEIPPHFLLDIRTPDREWLDVGLPSCIKSVFPDAEIVYLQFQNYPLDSYVKFLSRLFRDIKGIKSNEAEEKLETLCDIELEVKIKYCMTAAEKQLTRFYVFECTENWFKVESKSIVEDNIRRFFKMFMFSVHGFKILTGDQMLFAWSHIYQMRPNNVVLSLHYYPIISDNTQPKSPYLYTVNKDELALLISSASSEVVAQLQDLTHAPIDIQCMFQPFKCCKIVNKRFV
jgi:hypothetical protein